MTRANGLGALLVAVVTACASAPLPPPPPPPPPPPRPPAAPAGLALLAELQDVGVVERWGDAWVADPYRGLEHDTPLVARWLAFTRAQTAEQLPIVEGDLARIRALDAQPRARSVAALTRGVVIEEAQPAGRVVRRVEVAQERAAPNADAVAADSEASGAIDATPEVAATDTAATATTAADTTAADVTATEAAATDTAATEATDAAATATEAITPPAPAPPLSLDRALASSPSPDGRLVALVLAPSDEVPSPHLVVRDWHGALVDGPIADVVPVAPAWEGDDVLLYVLSGRGRSTVRRRFVGAGSDNDPVVLTELRDGDSIRLDAIPNGPAWVEAQRGEERTIWLRTGPTLFRRLAPLPAGPPAVVAGEHIAVADPSTGTLRIARTGRALRAAGWTDRALPGVSALALCGDHVLAVVRDGVGDALRFVNVVDGSVTPLESPGLGLVASIDGDANGAWLVWTDPTTPSALAHVAPDGALAWVEGAPSLVVRRQSLEATIGERRVSFEVAEVRRAGDPVSPLVVAEALGAFGVGATPAFRAGVAAYLEAGGRWAFVDVRGGGGHASAWHEDGRGAGESGAVADLRAGVEALAADGSRVALYGAAHGGLTAAGLVAREPRLVVGVVLHGPVTDLMRFDRFANAALWRSEYGDPSEEAAREWLRALSPYHRVRRDPRWPPTLVEAAREGERVSWIHGAKLAARLLETDAAALHVDDRLDDEARRARWARMLVFLRGLRPVAAAADSP